MGKFRRRRKDALQIPRGPQSNQSQESFRRSPGRIGLGRSVIFDADKISQSDALYTFRWAVGRDFSCSEAAGSAVFGLLTAYKTSSTRFEIPNLSKMWKR